MPLRRRYSISVMDDYDDQSCGQTSISTSCIHETLVADRSVQAMPMVNYRDARRSTPYSNTAEAKCQARCSTLTISDESTYLFLPEDGGTAIVMTR